MELLLLFMGTAGRARLEQTRSFTCVQAEGSKATWPLAAHLRGSRSKKPRRSCRSSCQGEKVFHTWMKATASTQMSPGQPPR